MTRGSRQSRAWTLQDHDILHPRSVHLSVQLLSPIAGAFNSLDLQVISANISTKADGQVLDVFRVTDSESRKVSPGQRVCRSCRSKSLALIAGCLI